MPLSQDPMARLLGITFAERTGAGVVTAAQVETCHLNPYRIAHGGFAYTMGCVTAMLSARLCLGRDMTVYTAASQYPAALAVGPVRCESALVFSDASTCAYDIRVTNAAGILCFSQLVTLRDARRPDDLPASRPRTIFPADETALKDPRTQTRLPLLSPGAFARLIPIYIMGIEGDRTVVAADILPQTCDAFGGAHPGLIYYACDTGLGTAAGLLNKIGVTVSSAMTYFRPAVHGPIRIEVSNLRMGRLVGYFEAVARDARGDVTAHGQFSMHPKGSIADLFTSEDYHAV